MDRNERINNPSEMFRLAMQANQARMWTALPGIVAKFPGSAGGAMTVDVQPTINAIQKDQFGKNSWVQMPVLLDCPLVFPGGGGATLTFPVKANTVINGVSQNDGDECIVIFSSRCIDGWWQYGGIQNQLDVRMHSLSDGFAFIGVRSRPKSFAVDTANVCLISDDQQTYIKMNPAGQTVAVQAEGGVNINGITIDSSGNLNCPATITATTDVIGGGKHLKTHEHTGVTTGTGVSGPPQ